jgi:tape measure domain-containing protein
MAQWETFGIQMVIRGASNFARDLAHMAMGLGSFSGELSKFQRSVEKTANANANHWSRIVQTTDKAIVRLAADYQKLDNALARANAKMAKEAKLANPATNPRGTAASYARHAQELASSWEEVNTIEQKLGRTQSLLDINMRKSADATTKSAEANKQLINVQDELDKSFNGVNAAIQIMLSKFGLSNSAVIKFAESMGITVPTTRAFVVVLNTLVLGINAVAFAVKSAIGIVKLLWQAFSFGIGIIKNVIVGIGKVTLSIISIPFKAASWGFQQIFESIRRIAEIAIGMNVSNLLWNIGQKIRGIGQQAYDAAVDFQLLQLRLRGLIQREMAESGDGSFSSSVGVATERAKELSIWISKLAVQSIFSAEDITNTMTLAMSYDMTEKNAKTLTLAIVNFATAMGLSDTHMRAIIENFGQMMAQGKLTGTELRDLARGAFFPINAVLEIMGKNLGFTGLKTGELKKKMQDLVTEGTVPVQAFMEAFIEFSQTNFPNAIQTASSSMKVAQSNISDLIDTVAGWRILTPIVDVLGSRISDFINLFLSDEVRSAAIDLGKGFGILTEAVMNMFNKGFGKFDIVGTAKKVNTLFSALKGLLDLNKFTPYMRGTMKSGPLSQIYDALKNFGIPSGMNLKITGAIDKIFSSIGEGKLDLSPLEPLFKTIIDQLYKDVIGPAFVGGWNFLSNKAQIVWTTYIYPWMKKIWENNLKPWLITLWTKDIPEFWVTTAGPAITTLVQKISEFFTANEPKLKEIGATVVKGITKFLNENSTSGSQVVTDIGNVLGSIFEAAVSTAIQIALGGFGAKAATAIDKTDTTLPDTMIAQLSPVSQAILDLRNNTRTALDESLIEFKQWAWDTSKPLRDISIVLTDINNVLSPIAVGLGSILNNFKLFEDARKWVLGLFGIDNPDSAFGQAATGSKRLSAIIGETIGGALILVGQLGQAISLIFQDAGLIASESGKFVGGKQDIQTTLNNITSGLSTNTDNFVKQWQKSWKDLHDSTIDTVEDLENKLVGNSIVPEMYAAMNTATTDGLNGVLDLVRSFKDTFIAIIASIDLYGIAYGIVVGMWKGMNDAIAAGGGVGSPSTGAWSGYKTTDLSPNRPKVGPLAATGLDYIVPKGFPNDTARVNVSSGERIIVIPSWKPSMFKYYPPLSSNTVPGNSVTYSNVNTFYNSYNLGVNSNIGTKSIVRDFEIMRLRR